MIDILRELINKSLMKEIDKNEVALLFSGGIDSLTCLFSLLELNITPTLYTFYLEGKPNDDLQYSEKIATELNLVHVIVEIPYNVTLLERDVEYIVKNLPVDRKTNIQCTFPFLYLLPKIKESVIVTGLCADDLYGSSKGMSIKGSKDKEMFDKLRNRSRMNLNSSAYLPIKTLVEEVYGKRLVVPYRDEDVFRYFMSKTWGDLNRPKQKQVAVDAYKNYFDKWDIYRKNSSLQVESGIREYHNELIHSSLNKNNRRRVDEIYKDLKVLII